MNLLGLIFGLLLIFACTFSLSMHKFLLSHPIEASCKNHLLVTRKILNSYEMQYYNDLKYTSEKKAKRTSSQKKSHPLPQKKAPLLNGECAQLNLWPLLLEGKNSHPALYELAAHLLRSFYQTALFEKEIRLEYTLLDTILDAAQDAKNDPNLTYLPLEKLNLKSKNVKQLYFLQSIYYRMLKGTKGEASSGYPSLIDYFLFENKRSSICLKHASMEMFIALFGSKAAHILYKEVHQEKIPLSKEHIINVCNQCGKINLSENILDLLDLRLSRHRLSSKKTLVETEGDVCLRKRVFLPSV